MFTELYDAAMLEADDDREWQRDPIRARIERRARIRAMTPRHSAHRAPTAHSRHSWWRWPNRRPTAAHAV
jgi:hypothetical protein